MTDVERRLKSALLLDGAGGARELNDDEVDNWRPADGLLWVDVDQNSRAGKIWLAEKSGLTPNVASILLAGETRPRSLVEGDGLIAVLRGINMNPGAVPDDMVAVRLSITGNEIITSSRRRVLSLEDLRTDLLAGNGPTTAGEFLVSLTNALSGRIESAVENIEDMIAALDERMSGDKIGDMRVDLGIVRRQAAAIRRHLAPQRDALDRMGRAHAGVLTDDEVFELREAGDRLTRHIEDLDLARENALVTQEELMNRVAMEQNSRMYLLSVVAAVFLPMTFATGMLGMNVAGLPGTVNPNGFIYSAIIMVVLGVMLIGYFRWRKWL